MAVTVSLKQNKNSYSPGYKKWYPRAKYGRIIDIAGLAQHIHDHHAIYPEDLVRGVLQCATRCTRELMLEGYPVKFDGLGIFKASVENSGGWESLDKVDLSIGGKNDNIQAIKLHATATGEFSRKELTGDAELTLTRDWREKVQKAKEEAKNAASGNTGDNSGEGGNG